MRRSAHVAGRSSASRSRGLRAADPTTSSTATASTPPGTVTPAARRLPDARPPPARTRAPAAEETTPPYSSDHPASGASAPCRVKRRKVKAVATSGPATGIETESALAARDVASMGRTATLAPPVSSSVRSIKANAAMEADSSAMAAGIQSQCRRLSAPNDAVTGARSLTHPAARAATAKAAQAALTVRLRLAPTDSRA